MVSAGRVLPQSVTKNPPSVEWPSCRGGPQNRAAHRVDTLRPSILPYLGPSRAFFAWCQCDTT